MKHSNNQQVYYLILMMLAIVCSLQLTSCKKYLNKKSDNSLITPNTLEDLQGMLDDNIIMNANTMGFGEASADDIFLQTDLYNSFDPISQKEYTWNLRIYNDPNDWGADYNVIYNANYCLDELNLIEKTPENLNQWNSIKGSALFYRGYYYLGLIWDFGKAYDKDSSKTDLGIVLRKNADFNIPSTRATVMESYNQVISDLTSAADYLPDNSAHPMRPSKPAAYGALARAWLSMRKYDSAFKYADKTLKMRNELLDYNSSEVDPSSYVPFAPFNKEIIFYSTESETHTATLYFYASIDTNLLAKYEPDDLRTSVFFFPYNGYYGFKGNYAGALDPYFSGIATDEMFLIRAECYARHGKVQEAMDDLNTLLLKRYSIGTFVPLAITNKEDALAKILLERRKELLMRGLRWIDIKRLNKENYQITPVRKIGSQIYTLPPNSNYYALPLPDDIIRITGMPQNE